MRYYLHVFVRVGFLCILNDGNTTCLFTLLGQHTSLVSILRLEILIFAYVLQIYTVRHRYDDMTHLKYYTMDTISEVTWCQFGRIVGEYFLLKLWVGF